MAATDINALLKSVVEQLKPADVEEVKYILKDKFAGMFHWILIIALAPNRLLYSS